jgi:hypothetical protein
MYSVAEANQHQQIEEILGNPKLDDLEKILAMEEVDRDWEI